MGKIIIESYGVLVGEGKLALEEIPARWRDAVAEYVKERSTEAAEQL